MRLGEASRPGPLMLRLLPQAGSGSRGGEVWGAEGEPQIQGRWAVSGASLGQGRSGIHPLVLRSLVMQGE